MTTTTPPGAPGGVGKHSQTMDRITEEALCDVQAQLYALRVAARAIARTHPDPGALLAAWHEALADAATCTPVAPTGWRSSDYLAERICAIAEDWTAELVELAVPGLDASLEIPDATAASDDTVPRPRPRPQATSNPPASDDSRA